MHEVFGFGGVVRVTHPPPPPPRARVTDQVTRRCTRGGGRGVLSLSLSLFLSLSLSLPSLPHSSLALFPCFFFPPSLPLLFLVFAFLFCFPLHLFLLSFISPHALTHRALHGRTQQKHEPCRCGGLLSNGGDALYAPDLPTLGASGREGRHFSLLFGAQPLRGTTLAPACPMRPASRSRHHEPSACSRMSHDLLVSHYASSHLSLL